MRVSVPAGMCVSMKEFDDNANKLPELSKPRQPFSIVSKVSGVNTTGRVWQVVVIGCCLPPEVKQSRGLLIKTKTSGTLALFSLVCV